MALSARELSSTSYALLLQPPSLLRAWGKVSCDSEAEVLLQNNNSLRAWGKYEGGGSQSTGDNSGTGGPLALGKAACDSEEEVLLQNNNSLRAWGNYEGYTQA